jgi:hypothetical protein
MRIVLGNVIHWATEDAGPTIRSTRVTPRRRNWSGRKPRWPRWVRLTAAWSVVALFFVVGAIAAISWAAGGHDGFLGVDRGCANNAFGCNAAVEFLGTASVIALAYVYFSSFRLRHITKHHLRYASSEPWRLVPTATEIEEVIGRDGICEIIETDLADRSKYRPQVIVAGVGDGKTAVLVRLTQMLYERGAVPVAVRLRDAQEELDFVELARKKFLESVERRLLSEEEGHKVWRELCDRRLIVTLADGLEEALPAVGSRGTAVRLAIEKARDAGMPLVIATRPDPVVEEIDVALIRLEPLPAEPVLDYIRKAPESGESDAAEASEAMPPHELRRLIRTAEVLERPLYLQLARDLYRRCMLNGVPTDAGRVRARFELLRTWRTALLEHPAPHGMRVRKADRERALKAAEEMACVAMTANKLEFEFSEVVDAPYAPLVQDREHAKMFAGLAERLDLVEGLPKGARFRHGVMEAYLGACCLPPLVRNGHSNGGGASTPRPYLDEALKKPGRELLMALVMCSLLEDDASLSVRLRESLRWAAEGRETHIAFELLAAAFEIDQTLAGDVDAPLQATAREVWTNLSGSEEGLETTEAKLRAILPMAEAGAYETLWAVCQVDDVYTVRFQAAQALAGGGEAALAVVLADIREGQHSADELLVHDKSPHTSADWRQVRRQTVLGWMMPLLAATSGAGAEEVREAIKHYVGLVKGGRPGNPRLHLGVEGALAQGFKWEANRVSVLLRDDRAGYEAFQASRAPLVDQALALLKATHWWYTQVSVLQALALWGQYDDAHRRRDIVAEIDRHTTLGHPIVQEVAKLCKQAVDPDVRETLRRLGRGRRPSRYVWIDEVGLANKVGSKDLRPDEPPDSAEGGALWIPPGAGWYSLASRGQQLVAQILLYLNLTEGGARSATDEGKNDRIREREQRRVMVHGRLFDVPRCIERTSERWKLQVSAPSGSDNRAPRRPVDGCPGTCGFNLCPYPTKLDEPFRGELPETFCRQQQRLLKGRSLPPAQSAPRYLGVQRKRAVRVLCGFWSDMEERAED